MSNSLRNAAAVIAALKDIFDDLPPALQVAARHLIDHPREAGVQSMRSLAAKASVHPNTFVRLARQIGFDGYEDLRERFRDFVVTDDIGGFRQRTKWLQELADKGGASAILAGMTEAVADNIERGFRNQRIDVLETACDRILAARRAYVLGMGSAYSLAHQFWYVARMAFDHMVPIPRHGSQPVDDLATICAEDVLVALTFQPYRAETLTAVHLAKRRGATVIGITDSATSPLCRESDIALICPTATPQFFQSHAAVTALLETLVALLVSRAGEEAQARIEAFHRERSDAGIYVEDARHTAIGAVRGGADQP